MSFFQEPTQASTIGELKRRQIAAERQMMQLVDQLDTHAGMKQPDYKECEELSRQSGRLCSRWKRLTSLSVEALVELDSEITLEQTEQSLLDQGRREYEAMAQKDEEEIKQLHNLVLMLQHFVSRAAESQQQQDGQVGAEITSIMPYDQGGRSGTF